VFGHRGFETIEDAILNREPFVILTGLAPTGNMHLGHKMVIDQVIYYQSLGAEISIVVADIEALGVRGIPLRKGRDLAIDQYIVNYIAIGLKPERCQIYFQSRRDAVKDLSYLLGHKLNLTELRAIYGFEDSTNMTHVFAPLVQMGDILHVQLPEYGGPRPTLVPVGVDQDPHIRLARELAMKHRIFNVMQARDHRIGVFVKVDENVDKLLDAAEQELLEMGFTELDKIPSYKAIYILDAKRADLPQIERRIIAIEPRFGGYGFYQPASTYHRFITGLTGGKMSSSEEASAIFLTDTVDSARKKVMAGKTGGAVSLKEQRAHGGNPEACTIYELYLYHLIEEDRELAEIYEGCKRGERTCGPCKAEAADRIETFLVELKERREAARTQVNAYIRDD
jgi:tryptophanyl-tRNA synthetase